MNLRNYVKRPEDRKIVYKNDNVKLEAIFERGLLNHIDGFYNMILYNNFSIGNNTNQEIFFVVNGYGEIFFNNRKEGIKKDYAFILPPKTHCIAENTSKIQPLEMLVITEQAPNNPNKKIIVRNSNKLPFVEIEPPLHWCHRAKQLFNYEKDNLSKIHYVCLVYIDKNQLAEPHKHFLGHDEVWHALEGKTKMAFRNILIKQAPGTSILIPDDGKTEHASIAGEEDAKFFFFMHHMALDNRLLVTGSEGRIGKIVTTHLKENGYQFVTEIDKENSRKPIDILGEDITPYLKDIDTVIHLAANPNPFIEKGEADKNIEITKKVIEGCRNSGVKRIINGSSINVYPYKELSKIMRETKLVPNRGYNPEAHYGRAKIECERLFEEYCRENEISLLNLRLGWVTKNDLHPSYKEELCDEKDLEILLKHADLKNIIKRAIDYQGIESYVCVSKKGGLVADDIRFPI